MKSSKAVGGVSICWEGSGSASMVPVKCAGATARHHSEEQWEHALPCDPLVFSTFSYLLENGLIPST